VSRGRSSRPNEVDVDGWAIAAAAIERHQKLFPDGWGIPDAKDLFGVAMYLARDDRPFDPEQQLQDVEQLFPLLFYIAGECDRLQKLAFDRARDKALPRPMPFQDIAPLIGVATRTGAENRYQRLVTATSRYIAPEDRRVPQTARAVRRAVPKRPKADPHIQELRRAAAALLDQREYLLTDEDVEDDLDTIAMLLGDSSFGARAQERLRDALADVCSGVRGLAGTRTDENQVTQPASTDTARRALLRVDRILRAEAD
jgi:hypothetical protein